MISKYNQRDITKIRIFISSPGDVRPERQIVSRVIDRLNRQLQYHFSLEPLLWERKPLVATLHFQEGLEPPSATDIVILMLWSRLGTVITDERFRGPISGRTVTGTEWEFEDAFLASSKTGTPDLLVYRKTGPALVAITSEDAVEQRRAVDAFIDRWFIDPETKAFKGAFHSFDTPTALEAMVEMHLRENLLLRLGPDHPMRAVRWHRGSPFLGLQSFDILDSPIFFGRTEARNRIREALAIQHAMGRGIVIVLGASGSGKTSVVKAGVLPDILVPGVLPRVGFVRYAAFRPGASGEIFDAFAKACAASSALPSLPSDFSERCRTPKAAVQATTDALAAEKSEMGLLPPWEARFVIVVDQLEEIFSSVVPIADRETFIRLLVACSAAPEILVLATLRSDFFPALEAYPELVTATDGEGRYLLRSPSAAELSQIVLFPPLEAGLTFERNPDTGITLDKVLEADAARGSGVLALLEFTLDQLWQQRTEYGELTYRAYQRLGGLEGAIGRQAERIYAAQPPAVQAGLPALLFALSAVDLDDPHRVVARLVPRDALGLGGAADLLALAFATPDARLVISSGDAGLLRFAHEAVLTYWPRAQAELNNIRSDLTVRGRLELAANLWRNAPQRDKTGFLLRRGVQLSAARSLLQHRGTELDELVAAYIKACDRNARKITFQLAAIACAVLLLSVGVAVFRIDANVAKKKQVAEQQKAWIAESRHDAMLSRQDAKTNNFPGAIAIAIQGLPHNLARPSRPLVQDDLNALREAMVGLGNNAASTKLIGGDVLNFNTFPEAVLSPDGRYLALYDSEAQTIGLWSAITGQMLGSLQIPPPNNVVVAGQTGMVFSGDGSKLLVAYIDNGFAIFDTASRALVDKLTSPTGILSLRNFQTDQRGDRLLTNGNKGCEVWDFSAGKKMLSCGTDKGENAILSPDGRYVFSWSSRGNALWYVNPGRTPATLPAPHSLIYAAAFSSDSQEIATGSANGFVTVTQTGAPATSRQVFQSEGSINGLRFSPDGAALALVPAGGLPEPDLAAAQKDYPSRTFYPQNPQLMFSPDGRTLISPIEDPLPMLLDLQTGTARHLDAADPAMGQGLAMRVIDTKSGAELMAIRETTLENKLAFTGNSSIVTIDPTGLISWNFRQSRNFVQRIPLAGRLIGCLGTSGKTILALGNATPALIDIASKKVTSLNWNFLASDSSSGTDAFLFSGKTDQVPHILNCDGHDIASGFLPPIPQASAPAIISPTAPPPATLTPEQQNAIDVDTKINFVWSLMGVVKPGLALDPEQKFAFIGNSIDRALLINTRTRKIQLLPLDLSKPTFSQGARYLAVVDGTNEVILFDPNTGRLLGYARFTGVTVTALAFDKAAASLFVGKSDGSISRVPLPSGNSTLIQGADGDAVDQFRVIASGSILAIGDSGAVSSFDPKGKHEGRIHLTAPKSDVSISGNLLLSVGTNGPLTIWNVAKATQIAQIHAPNGTITGMIVSPAGGTVATTDTGGDITVWNVQTGAEIENLPMGMGPLFMPQYDATGQNILALIDGSVGPGTAFFFHKSSDQALINEAIRLTRASR